MEPQFGHLIINFQTEKQEYLRYSLNYKGFKLTVNT